MAMKNKTRRALVLSVLSLILCCSMLVGTTFAWFTDNVTNGVNTIQSGNLDIELYHANFFDAVANGSISGFGMTKNYEGHKVETNTALFLNKEGKPILWEPGATAVENFRIKNEGTVALKYTFKLDILNATKTPAGKDLTEILELYIDDITYDASNNDLPVGTTVVSGEKLGNGYVLEGTLEAGEERNFWIGLEWEPTDYDNDFNVKGGLKLNLGVTLQATQHTFEYDGYNGNTYDAGATYDVLATPDTFVQSGEDKAANTQALTDAITAGDVDGDGKMSIVLGAGEYTMPTKNIQNKTLSITGTKDTQVDMTQINNNASQFATGATVEFDGVTVNFGTANYKGITHAKSVTYKNCTINGLQFLYADNVTFENCELVSTGEHCVWTYGAQNVTFANCKFTYGDRCINVYCDNDIPGGKQTVNFSNCTFSTANTASKGAVEINSSKYSNGAVVNLTGCTAPANGEMAYVSEWDGTNGAKTTINVY